MWDKFLAAGASVAGEDFAERHRTLKQADDLQFNFPAYDPPEPPGWLQAVAEFLGLLAPVLGFLLRAGVVILVLVLLYFLAREASRQWSLRRARSKESPDETPTIAPEVARRLLADADALASEGRYAEAIHALLHRSIAEFDKTKIAQIQDSLTSREIAQLPTLPSAARGAFATIAAAVERSFFGGRDVDAAIFAECRSAYSSFALPGAAA